MASSPAVGVTRRMSGFSPLARAEVLQLRSSKIREVANAGLGRADVLAFWFGESDRATPQAIRDAAAAALMQGRTFYTHPSASTLG